MNYVDNIRIDGFWGNHSVNIKFHKDINFLIGVNGSGKTTVINLIAAVLTADFGTLDRYEFDKITLTLRSGRRRPRVEVEKMTIPGEPFPIIGYEIADSATGNPIYYPLGGLEKEYMLRSFRRMPRHPFEHETQRRRRAKGLRDHLARLINVRWLSVNRSKLSRTVHDEEEFESSVDQKVKDLRQQFAIYFGSLEGSAKKEIDKYQKQFFLSLIPNSNENQILLDDKSLDLDREQSALQEIYRHFKIPERDYEHRLDEFFTATKESFRQVKQVAQESPPLYRPEDITNIIGIWRINDLVQEWEKLNSQLRQIYHPRDNFLEILKGLLQKKVLVLNEKNEISVRTTSGKEFSVTGLSSGEKQLLIILGEALLETQDTWVYIADEPELSLHVRWQEQLIANIRSVNSKAQIIVATHSPDIVSNFQDKVIEMEDALR